MADDPHHPKAQQRYALSRRRPCARNPMEAQVRIDASLILVPLLVMTYFM
jgi:hypothetical protein